MNRLRAIVTGLGSGPGRHLLLFCILAGASSSARAQEEVPLLGEVWSALSAEDATDESVDRDLAALGEEAVAALCAALAGEQSGHEPALRPRPDEDDTRRLEASIRRHDKVAVLRHVDDLVANEPSVRTRVHALRLLGLCGSADDVEQFLLVAKGIDMAHLRSPWVERHVQSTIRALMTKDARTFGKFSRAWKDADALRKPIAAAAGEVATPAGLKFLTETLQSGLDAHAVRAMTTIVKTKTLLLRASTRRILERALDERHPVSADVVELLSASRCTECSEALVRLLGSPDMRIRRSSHSALQNLTGVKRPADAESWESYLAEEHRWYREDFDDLARDVDSGEAARVVRALKKLRGHRLHGEAIIEITAPLLFGRTEPARSVLAIEAIESTNSLVAVADLVEALASESETVRSRAHRALSRLLGRDLGVEATAWREAYPHLLR